MMGFSMHQVLGIQRGLTPGRICAVLFLLLSVVGCVISPRRTLGGGPTPTPTPTGSPTPTPPAATGKLYVSNGGTSSILRFDDALTASGNIVPAATISGTNTTLNGPAFITLDVVADRLYVANNGDISILIFDNISTKNGNIAPERAIFGSLTTLVSPTDLSLDKSRDLLYVADDTEVRVFSSASTANGNMPPARTLSLTFAVSAVFIDSANDRLYAADQLGNAIAVFDSASSLNGSVTANRTIQGAATHLNNPGSIQLDGSGRLIISNATPPGITIYNSAATANGNAAPAAEIAGSNTGMSTPDQIVVNTSGTGSLYNADPKAARIAIFSNLNTANGNIAPTRTIFGASTGLTVGGQPVGVALDATR
jgi:6-phosphogluconolactonase (cycloisomerase 2 family)